MIDRKYLGFAVIPFFMLAACSNSQSEQTAGSSAETTDAVSVHEEMIDTIIPQTQVIWDVSNTVYNDEGNPDPAMMTDADWAKVKAASGKVMASLDRLATSNNIIAAKPGAQIMDQDVEGGTKPQEVQKMIDTDLDGFHEHAKQLKDFFSQIDKAADARDFQTFYDKAGEADGACESCHEEFWFKQPT